MGRSDWTKVTAAAALVLVVLVAYAPAFKAGFIIDDDEFLGGKQTEGHGYHLSQIWSRMGETHQYYPLVYTSFWVESRLYGVDPHPYHRTNILLHALNAILLWIVLRRLGLPGAWLASMFFALHPVQVESVAWIAERKNLLSASFYFLSILSFIRFYGLDRTAPPSGRTGVYYGLGVVTFAGALLSKTVTLTLPAVIALLIWWKRGRISRGVMLSLAPLFAIGIGFGLLTNWVERNFCGAAGPLWDLSAAQRILLAGRACCFYVTKLIWPFGLSFNYERWTIASVPWRWVPYPVAVFAVVGILWTVRRRIGRGPLTAILFFIGTLAPVLGFFNLFFYRYSYVADHFQYLACIGPIVLVLSSSTAFVSPRGPRGRTIGCALGVILLVGLCALTWNRSHAFEDREVLCRDILKKNPRSWLAENNLGDICLKRGDLDSAMEHFERALRLGPSYIETRIDLAIALMNLGRPEEAIGQAKAAVEIDPRNAIGYHELGSAYLRAGRPLDAVPCFRHALSIDPVYVSAQIALGTALTQIGEAGEGVAWFETAIRSEPKNPTAITNLGIALAKLGRCEEAVRYLEEADRLDPGNPVITENLRLARERAGEPPETGRRRSDGGR